MTKDMALTRKITDNNNERIVDYIMEARKVSKKDIELFDRECDMLDAVRQEAREDLKKANGDLKKANGDLKKANKKIIELEKNIASNVEIAKDLISKGMDKNAIIESFKFTSKEIKML